MKTETLTLQDLKIDKADVAAEIYVTKTSCIICVLKNGVLSQKDQEQRLTVLDRMTDIADLILIENDDEVLHVSVRRSTMEKYYPDSAATEQE